MLFVQRDAAFRAIHQYILLESIVPSNGLRLSGRPHVQFGRDEPFGGRSAPTAG